MTFLRFRHAIQNAFAFFIGLARCELAINLRCLHFRAPVAFHDLDCLLSIFLIAAHTALKTMEQRLPSRRLQSRGERLLSSSTEERARGEVECSGTIRRRRANRKP